MRDDVLHRLRHDGVADGHGPYLVLAGTGDRGNGPVDGVITNLLDLCRDAGGHVGADSGGQAAQRPGDKRGNDGEQGVLDDRGDLGDPVADRHGDHGRGAGDGHGALRVDDGGEQDKGQREKVAGKLHGRRAPGLRRLRTAR